MQKYKSRQNSISESGKGGRKHIGKGIVLLGRFFIKISAFLFSYK
ncbi:hypothetical protein HMPREF3191_01616 [Veillonellaceae bacterium DNF00626]|nr:hypothetical protein HMPREF3191_01616 [Veillonellaceae bacterium DNF00626]